LLPSASLGGLMFPSVASCPMIASRIRWINSTITGLPCRFLECPSVNFRRPPEFPACGEEPGRGGRHMRRVTPGPCRLEAIMNRDPRFALSQELEAKQTLLDQLRSNGGITLIRRV
jgi:hypothetical protein